MCRRVSGGRGRRTLHVMDKQLVRMCLSVSRKHGVRVDQIENLRGGERRSHGRRAGLRQRALADGVRCRKARVQVRTAVVAVREERAVVGLFSAWSTIAVAFATSPC